ncbi:hypothetical protein NPX13_g1748 [Xylaria arbuscula]|uniref:Uncharacterized protein n=1 Tax=Xylaria arbuscula TaxID=114810 RepID=A0A9W8TRM4_9PEZI|nr:hypothetical protein NPX13_g1748 [Xylaria arbuscula]
MATASYHNYINSIRGTSGVFWLASSLIFGILFYIAIRRLQKLGPQEEDASKRSSDHPEAMTLEEAYRIKTRIAERDFPLVFSTATNSVFFKVKTQRAKTAGGTESTRCFEICLRIHSLFTPVRY